MSGATKIAAGAASGFCLLVVLIAAATGSVAALFAGSSASGATTCIPVGATSAAVAGYQPTQISNAAIIVAVGHQLDVPTQGQVVAIAAALQESSLTNLEGGDRDSLGLFQQRPSQGWGTPAQIMNPAYAATQFYQHLLAIPDWQQLSVNDAAQAVQNSGTPDAYGPHEAAARTIVAAVADASCASTSSGTGTTGGTGSDGCTSVDAPDPAVLTAIDYACAQLGLPYQWDGSGPQHGDAGFDCSGLTQAAYAAAGISLPHNAAQQYAVTAHVPPGAPLEPGDLVFFGTSPATIHHVGLYLGSGLMIDAPDFGLTVRVENYKEADFFASGRPTATPRA
ncbi:MAG TPA: C40 family peptidase [Jatrophihabitans sp.]|nr:C40 family peptidase [Jatrophihabitans sp.]